MFAAADKSSVGTAVRLAVLDSKADAPSSKEGGGHRGVASVPQSEGNTLSPPPMLRSATGSASAHVTGLNPRGPRRCTSAEPAGGDKGNNAALAKMQVLLVDDDCTIRKLAQKFLSRHGVGTVICASDGRQAWEKVQQRWSQGAPADSTAPDTGVAGQFHAIVTDQSMPNMLGSQLCQHVTARAGELACACPLLLAVTGNALSQDVAQLKASGAQQVFSKPVEFHDVLQALKAHAERLAL